MKLNIETKFDKNDIFYAISNCGDNVSTVYSKIARERYVRVENATTEEEREKIEDEYRIFCPCVEMHIVRDLSVNGDGNVVYEDERNIHWKETKMYTLQELDKALNFISQKLKENEDRMKILLNKMKD